MELPGPGAETVSLCASHPEADAHLQLCVFLSRWPLNVPVMQPLSTWGLYLVRQQTSWGNVFFLGRSEGPNSEQAFLDVLSLDGQACHQKEGLVT